MSSHKCGYSLIAKHVKMPILSVRHYNVLNEDYLIISWYLHVWNGVAVARNPPAWPGEKRSLSENLVNDRRIPNPAQVRLRTETGMWLNFIVLKFRLGSASEPNVCSHCYSVPWTGFPQGREIWKRYGIQFWQFKAGKRSGISHSGRERLIGSGK